MFSGSTLLRLPGRPTEGSLRGGDNGPGAGFDPAGAVDSGRVLQHARSSEDDKSLPHASRPILPPLLPTISLVSYSLIATNFFKSNKN